MHSFNMFDGSMGFPTQFQNARKRSHDASGDDAATAPKRQHNDRSTPPAALEPPLMHSTPQMFGMAGREMFNPNNIPGMFFPQNMMGMNFQFPSPIPNGVFNQTGTSSDDSGLNSDMSAENSTRSQSTDVEDEDVSRHAEETVALFVPDDEKPCAMPVRGPVVLTANETFATVPGRMTLLAATTKYRVTIGEIHRRISPPECLHASLVNGILRRAKAKDGNKTLRNELSKIGMSLPSGRRKMAPATSFTALCEEEAVGMARDFKMLAERQFPAAKIAESMVQKRSFSPQEVQKLMFQFMILKDFMREFHQIMSSLPEHPKDFDPATALLDPVQQVVNHFSLVTHGFGHNALAVAAETFATVAERGIKYSEMYSNMLTAGGLPQPGPNPLDCNWM